MEKARRSRALSAAARARYHRRPRTPLHVIIWFVKWVLLANIHTRVVVPVGVCVDFYSLILKRSGFFSGRVLGGTWGVKIGDGRRAGCHRRGLLNRLVRGRTEPPICTCTRVINGLRTDFKSWNNSLLQEKLSGAYRTLAVVFYKLNCIKMSKCIFVGRLRRSLSALIVSSRRSQDAPAAPRVYWTVENTRASDTHTHEAFFFCGRSVGWPGGVSGRRIVKNTRKKAKL